MKPEQFIREQGLDKAREVVSTGSDTYVFKPEGKKKYVHLSIANLKRLVESVDLIKWHGGTKFAKDYLARNKAKHPNVSGWDELEQAIKDHESIYGGGDE